MSERFRLFQRLLALKDIQCFYFMSKMSMAAILMSTLYKLNVSPNAHFQCVDFLPVIVTKVYCNLKDWWNWIYKVNIEIFWKHSKDLLINDEEDIVVQKLVQVATFNISVLRVMDIVLVFIDSKFQTKNWTQQNLLSPFGDKKINQSR